MGKWPEAWPRTLAQGRDMGNEKSRATARSVLRVGCQISGYNCVTIGAFCFHGSSPINFFGFPVPALKKVRLLAVCTNEIIILRP
jgi:hypothetical protein